MIYIYSHSTTNRLKYTLDVLFKNILQVNYKLVDRETFTEDHKFPKINYSDEKVKESIWIKPHALLFKKNIESQNIAVTHKDGVPYFFETSKTADFRFDVLASSFYMLSRYEEYLPFTPDEHNRFSAEHSLAFKANFLQKPVVHLWAEELRDAILKQRPVFLFPTRIFTQINTIDVDIAYAYKGKPFFRFLGGIIKSWLQFDFRLIAERFNYYINGVDPYDTYTRIKKLQDQSNSKIIFFFQVGKYGRKDKNLPLKKTMSKLIVKISEYADIGLHPSYASNNNPDALNTEHTSLSKITGKPVTQSRQHYLKLRFPETYENLISVGITADYTLGFSDRIGFRSGMAIPYQFFNLQTNLQRPLSIVPFQVMEGTLKDYMKLSPTKAIEEVSKIKSEIRAVNGEFVSIFHNSSLTDKGEFEGWLEVYKQIIQ